MTNKYFCGICGHDAISLSCLKPQLWLGNMHQYHPISTSEMSHSTPFNTVPHQNSRGFWSQINHSSTSQSMISKCFDHPKELSFHRGKSIQHCEHCDHPWFWMAFQHHFCSPGLPCFLSHGRPRLGWFQQKPPMTQETPRVPRVVGIAMSLAPSPRNITI